MNKILVIGASGFVGRHLARGLLQSGKRVRCLARTPSRIEALSTLGGEVVRGDINDIESMRNSLKGMDAVYICTHSLSPQAAPPESGFMEIEMKALQNVVQACRDQGVRRLIYITFLGISPKGSSLWSRERWKVEQFLLNCGLDVTVLRPGQIVGFGGQGFNMMMGQAKRRFTPVLGSGRTKMQNIAVDDLVYYLVGVLDEVRAFGQSFDVGTDEIFTSDQMIDIAAEVLGNRPPHKIHLPVSLVLWIGPLIEKKFKMPKGVIRGILGGSQDDIVGDPQPIRKLLTKPLLTYRNAIQAALDSQVQCLYGESKTQK